MKMAAVRVAYIDQSQSLSLHVAELGLKTGMYYLCTKAAAQAIQFNIDKTKAASKTATGGDAAATDTDLPVHDGRQPVHVPPIHS